MSTLVEKTALIAMSIKDFVVKNNFVQLAPVVRVNENGYPFITFINALNSAENVYFSKAAAEAIDAGMPVTKEMLRIYQIGVTRNEAGEERIKLISNSDRIDISSLLD